jgi:hypothetical protein
MGAERMSSVAGKSSAHAASCSDEASSTGLMGRTLEGKENEEQDRWQRGSRIARERHRNRGEGRGKGNREGWEDSRHGSRVVGKRLVW